ncbi:RNA polymerase sigma factor [Candidatus Eisenbacteria bacterium]|uniref:RNA polymerase sigma factor n=1 Tax=Eiseniibacteriota bacterium TaxID=2212470 RepID=A0ABV6YKR2_UNCEI
MTRHPGHPSEEEQYAGLIAAFVAKDPAAADRLYQALHRPVRTAVLQFFPPDGTDVDDVVQETILAVFNYVRKQGGFEGDLIRFAITIARNRCRNIANARKRRPNVPLDSLENWIASPEKSPLDILLEHEVEETLRAALATLGRVCRQILRAFYIEGHSIENIRQETGLKTVQGVYYRRSVCLDRLGRVLAKRLAIDRP